MYYKVTYTEVWCSGAMGGWEYKVATGSEMSKSIARAMKQARLLAQHQEPEGIKWSLVHMEHTIGRV